MSDLIAMLQSVDWEHAPPALFRLVEIAMRGLGTAGATFLLGAKGRGEAKKIDAIATVMQKHSSAPLFLEYKDEMCDNQNRRLAGTARDSLEDARPANRGQAVIPACDRATKN